MATWQLFENILDDALTKKGYTVLDNKSLNLKCSFTGRKHLPDKLIQTQTEEIIVLSKKWQESRGTAEEKVIYEIFKLLDLLNNQEYKIKSCYIILGGMGWSKQLKEYYLSHKWNNFLENDFKNKVKIVIFDEILTLINKGLL